MGNGTSVAECNASSVSSHREFKTIVAKLEENTLTDEQLLKITRQLSFYAQEKSVTDLEAVADRLIGETKFEESFKVPTKRFGKTNVQMPVITCGGMRVQQTWVPDTVPLIGTSSMKRIAPACQENLVKIIRGCLARGINHFETARFYGTSEMQFCDAFDFLLKSGEVKREDLIIQTKVPPAPTLAKFKAGFASSWKHLQKLEYIDLFSFHGPSLPGHYDVVFEGPEANMPYAEELKAEGKIKHIGFSTHGDAEHIRRMIMTDKFEYINIHRQYFGSYHAEGTPDGQGGYGNDGNLKLCKEKDMGVFIISPFDKGGYLQEPSRQIASLIGKNFSPLQFQALYSFFHEDIHTISCGFARPSDFDDVVAAAKMYAKDSERTKKLYDEADVRLTEHAEATLRGDRPGEKSWVENCYNNVPSMTDPVCQGVAIGHILWLHNLIKAYGMYSFCKQRYNSLEETKAKWNAKKTAEENIAAWSFNPGIAYTPGMDLSEALKDCDEKEKIVKNLEECHGWLCKKGKGKSLSDEFIKEKQWEAAYSMGTWGEFPGSIIVKNLLLQQLTRGYLGNRNNGPEKDAKFLTSIKSTKAVLAEAK